MHRILKSHLENFVSSFELSDLGEAKQFEQFVNYCVIAPRTAENFDIGDVTTGEGDSGIDGVAIVVDEEVVLSASDAELVFSTEKKNHDVDLIFCQAKTSEGFDLGDFLKFQQGVLAFVNSDSFTPPDEVEAEAHETVNVFLNNVP